MFYVLSFTILYTFAAYLLLKKFHVSLQSVTLFFVLSWFTGLYISTFSIFFLAILLKFFTSYVLFKSTVLWTLVLLGFVLSERRQAYQFVQTVFQKARSKRTYFRADIIFFAFCFYFSYIFFITHLSYSNNVINTSPIYWDFHWHVGLIQNFTYGDNFPPENESFTGMPQAYHYYGDFIVSLYEVFGLNIVDSMNYTSIFSFFIVLLALIGLSEEFFKTKIPGYIAVLFAITSSSWRFISYFADQHELNIIKIFQNIISNNANPFAFGHIPNTHPGSYTGTMHNMFYLLEERHMIFGIVYLLLCIMIIVKKDSIPNKYAFIIGMAMGAFFYWHIYITFIVLGALVFVLIFDNNRKKTLLLLSGLTLLFGAQFLHLKYIIASNKEWLLSDTESYPKFDITFATIGEKSNPVIMLVNIFKYYSFSYGLKFIFLPVSLFYLWRRKSTIGKTLTGFILICFICINTLLISSQGIGENHKFLRPMNFVIDIAVAYFVYKLFFQRKKVLLTITGLLCIIVLTLSGFIELFPFLNSKPILYYSDYPSSITKAISQHTHKSDIFIGFDGREIQLAGRKLFFGDILGPMNSFNLDKRKNIIDTIYNSKTKEQYCQLINAYKINYIEYYRKDISSDRQYLMSFPKFDAISNGNLEVYFFNVNSGCKGISLNSSL